MKNVEHLCGIGEEIEKRLRLQTFPLAVKLLESEKDIPEGAERPLQHMGFRVPLCQGFAMSRKDGKTVAMFKEDMVCFEPIVGYGWEEPPQYFLDGNNRVPQDVQDLAAGKNYASDFPRISAGKYRGAVSAPLTSVNFMPDLVMFYCDSAQLSLLLLGREYKDGHDIKCSLSSHAACVYAVVPVMKGAECQVAIPCRGDRYLAGAGDNEIILTLPISKIDDLLTGLRHVEKYGSKLPKNYRVMREPEMPDSYRKILGMLK